MTSEQVKGHTPDRELIADILALDKAIDDFLGDLRTRASWDPTNIDDDGTVSLPCGVGVLYRLGAARESLGKHVARAAISRTGAA